MSATFDEWVKAVFEHQPAKKGEKEWYWGEEFDDFWEALRLSDDLTVSYLTQLFRNPRPLNAYSLDQIAQGIWFLVGDASPAEASHLLVYSRVPLDQRVEGIRSIADFFRRFVVPAATGPARENEDAFHGACYMWWDIFPTWGGVHPHAAEAAEAVAKLMDGAAGSAGEILAGELEQISEPQIHEACLEVMAKVVDLPTELCQLSALHGLNHWHLHHAGRVERIIDAYLENSMTATPRMREYAGWARKGCCQ